MTAGTFDRAAGRGGFLSRQIWGLFSDRAGGAWRRSPPDIHCRREMSFTNIYRKFISLTSKFMSP
jgi:hypothetical protein